MCVATAVSYLHLKQPTSMILLFDHIDMKTPCIYLLLTSFPYNKIDQPLHCYSKVIVLFLSYFLEL